MLVLTHDAATVIRSIVESSEVPEEGGLRISSRPTAEEHTALELSVAPEPDALDEVIEQEGAHVFLEPAVADALFDKVLDAAIQEDGVHFQIIEQEMQTPPPSVDGSGPER